MFVSGNGIKEIWITLGQHWSSCFKNISVASFLDRYALQAILISMARSKYSATLYGLFMFMKKFM